MRPSGLRLALASIAILSVAGCGGGGDTREPAATHAGPATTELAAPCGEEGATAITFRAPDGTEVGAAAVGEGELGVVLGHQFRSDFCSWLPFGNELAGRRMRVLALNFPGTDHLDPYMAAAAVELRRRGAKRVVLVGASMGGTAALVAASRADVAGVASLSAPREFGGMNAGRAVRRLDVPALYVAARDDGTFARDARKLYRATRSTEKELLVTRSFEHGTDLLQDETAKQALLAFLERLREPR